MDSEIRMLNRELEDKANEIKHLKNRISEVDAGTISRQSYSS